MDVRVIEINKKRAMEGMCARSVLVLPIPDQAMTDQVQVREAQRTAEKESDVAMVAEELPVFQLNCTEGNTLSEIQGPEAAVTSAQDPEQDGGDHVSNDEENDDFKGCQKDRTEAEVDGDEDYFFPSVEDVEKARPPEVGMVFPTLQDAHRFLNVYGLLTGFVVKKGCNYKHKKITFVCNKSSKMKVTETGQKKRRSNAIEKTGCRMKVLVKLVEGRWEIKTVVNEHNHPLMSSPSLSTFFISHKYMSEEERIFSRILQESKIKPSQIMEIFKKLRSRLKHIPVRKMDANSLKQSDSQMEIRNTDIEITLEHVRRFQMEQPGFFYAIKTDDRNTVRSIFWTDARARLDYALYGDFISFDTSYTTREHNMLFAPLIGINGHGKAIVFGWGLLENEMADKADTFSWLLRTFLDVMDGKKPTTIITDQGSAMTKSIAEVFPTVFHRFSMWHVMRKAREIFEDFMENGPVMEADLTCLIANCLTIEEFEDGWKTMLEKYDAPPNEDLNLMYQTRLMWVPVYFKHAFCPFIRSTGRSESTDTIFKEHGLRKDAIENFFCQYDIFQKNVISPEDGYGLESTQKKTMYCTRQPIERHAAEVYTMGMFLKFQKELLDASAFNVFEIESGRVYAVKKTLDYEEAEFPGDSFSVEVDLGNNMFNCICSKFERDGMLCCHVLRLLTQFGVNVIPENYIRQRWTKKFREELQKLHGTEKTRSTVSQNAL
ncbi:protein FAR1-RELATED SEQUENCE 5 isoform X2 [Setaria viridis]|uniref:Protein FAR1-RELATED SEQUENCE n=1 Tax=Setaria viridis TaxID=4556 RepID=A0A4U6TRS4_SETVI|nr:protein FAR1-RELATED SEQUENCE 5-like isoform X2 [Setaria viridis]TKW03399.1 hypothetical protein SEVIR_7G020700v2 [Setaria viridis]